MSAVRETARPGRELARYRAALGEDLDAELARWVSVQFDDVAPIRRAPILAALDSGKHLRGATVSLACEALGGERAAAIPAAVAIECIHAASLIHDDFVDGDRVRRDRAALWTIDGAREAVLVADVMFATAIDRMVSLDPSAGVVVSRAIAQMAAGAYHEFRGGSAAGSDGTPSDDGASYERVVALKTGALFAAAASLGALVAGAPAAMRELARVFGEHLGRAYQVADDLADLIALDGAPAPPALVHAIRHFDPAGERAAPAAHSAIAPAAIAARMRAAIAADVDLARRALDRFPDNAYARMLRALPSAAVGAQIA